MSVVAKNAVLLQSHIILVFPNQDTRHRSGIRSCKIDCRRSIERECRVCAREIDPHISSAKRAWPSNTERSILYDVSSRCESYAGAAVDAQAPTKGAWEELNRPATYLRRLGCAAADRRRRLCRKGVWCRRTVG